MSDSTVAYNERAGQALERWAHTLRTSHPAGPDRLRERYAEIVEPVFERDLLRYARADGWCVVKTDTRHTLLSPTRSWPGQAYQRRRDADAWREFLEDYYWSTNERDGLVRWEVKYLEGIALSDFGDPQRPIGSGYYDRQAARWVGTLPMRVYTYDREARCWVYLETVSS